MLLIDRQIKKHIEWGSIIIDPFVPEQLNNASYDLSLGPHIARYMHDDVVHLGTMAPRFVIEDCTERGFVTIGANERILGHSVEFAGGQVAYAPQRMTNVAVNTHLQAKSTAARSGLTVCMCAGWGDVGFISRWTFEIQNMSPNTLRLPVGALIAQLVFHEVETPSRLYHETTTQQYQLDKGLADVQKNWTPQAMLPGLMKVTQTWKRSCK